MRGIMVGIGILGFVTMFLLYCCVRAGAQEDRWLEEMDRKGWRDEGRKCG